VKAEAPRAWRLSPFLKPLLLYPQHLCRRQVFELGRKPPSLLIPGNRA